MQQTEGVLFTRWYKRWWGVVLLVLFAFSAVVLILIAVLTSRYYWQIKQGQGVYLQNSIYGSFSESVMAVQSKNKKINRSQLETSDDPFYGNPSAKLVVVEFVDFKCPNCKASAAITKRLLAQYNYKIKFIIRDFPAESLHSGATQLAEIAYCADQQGHFWSMYDALFANQSALSSASLTEVDIKNLASSGGVDYSKLSACLQAGAGKTEVNKDYADGMEFGVKGTPTFFINGQKIEGVIPYDSWEKVVAEFK